MQCQSVSVGKLRTSPSCNSNRASYSGSAIVSGPRHPQVPWNLSSETWWIPVPTPHPICTDGYEEVTDPTSSATDCSIASRSATSAAMNDMVTLAVDVQRFCTSFMHEVNFRSSFFYLSASASVLSSFNGFTFFGAVTASFGHMESTGSSLRYLRPNCAPPPFSAKVEIERLPWLAILVAIRLMAEAAWSLRLPVSTPAFCNPRDATMISHSSYLIVMSLPLFGRIRFQLAATLCGSHLMSCLFACRHQARLAGICASLSQAVPRVQHQQMIPILLNILRKMGSPHVLGATAPINLQAIVIHLLALASHSAEVQGQQ